jgi:hypothetical protein
MTMILVPVQAVVKPKYTVILATSYIDHAHANDQDEVPVMVDSTVLHVLAVNATDAEDKAKEYYEKLLRERGFDSCGVLTVAVIEGHHSPLIMNRYKVPDDGTILGKHPPEEPPTLLW